MPSQQGADSGSMPPPVAFWKRQGESVRPACTKPHSSGMERTPRD